MASAAGDGKVGSALQWLSLVSAIWLQSINGTNFTFPAYSPQLKSLLSMSQLQLINLAFASDAGKLVGWVSGVAANLLPLWLVLLIGSCLGLVGYGVQVLFLTKRIIHSLSYFQLFLLTLIAGNSISWINTVTYKVAINNFPSELQMAVGLSNSYQGLSAEIYASIVNVMLSPTAPPTKRATAYLFLNTFMPLLVCIISMPGFLPSSSTSKDNINNPSTNTSGANGRRGATVSSSAWSVVIMYGITIGTGVFALVSTSLGSSMIYNSLSMIGLGVFLALPLVVPIVVQIRKWQMFDKDVQEWKVYDVKRVHSVELQLEEVDYRVGVNIDNYSDEACVVSVEEQHEVSVDHQKKRKEKNNNQQQAIEEIGVKLMLQRVNFWLYFFSYLFGATVGFVFLNNLGQIAESRGYSGTDTLVSISSSFGFFGRLFPSLLDYVASRWKARISRPACMAALMGPMSGALFLLVRNEDWTLYMGTASIGLCTGAITSIAVSMTTELFGSKNFSVNHNILVANIPVGSFVFGSLAAVNYRRHAAKQGTGDKCIGSQCYSGSFLFWGSLCVLGTILALSLHTRTRNFYSAQKS